MATLADDISAKVAAMLFEQIVRGLDFGTDLAIDLFKITGTTFNSSAGALKKAGEQLRKVLGEKKYDDLINSAGKIPLGQMDELLNHCEVNSQTITIDDADADRFEQLLNQDKVLYAKVDLKEDNCKMFVFLDISLDSVNRAAKLINAERGAVTELSPDLFMQTDITSSLREVSGLNSVELELFRHYAKQKSNLFFTVLPGKNDNNTLIINTSNANATQAAQRTMTEVGWALTGGIEGERGERVRKQVEYRIAGRTSILQSIDDAQKELFIVNKKDPSQFAHINHDEYEIYKANNLLKRVTKLENNHEDFREDCLNDCFKIPNAVVLTAKEVENGISKEMLTDRMTLDLFPEDFNEVHEHQMMNDMIYLVQEGIKDRTRRNQAMEKENKRVKNAGDKMDLDDEGNSGISVWDESVTYSEFAQYEFLADEDQRRSREYQFDHFKDAAFYSKRNFETQDYKDLENNLDVIIAKAEQKRRAREEAAVKMHDSMNKSDIEQEQDI